MPNVKRKHSADNMPQPTPKKAKKTAADKTSYTSQQKAAIQQYVSITTTDKSSAAKVLKQHNWNVDAAINSFYSNGKSNANSPVRATLNQTFDKYRDDPKEEPDEINVEGMQQLLNDIDVDVEDIGALIFSELVASPSLGKITREGFVDGFADLNIDSIPTMRDIIKQRSKTLSSDKQLFKNVYNHTFVLPLSGSQKALPLEQAEGLWRTLFSPAGFEWRTKSTDWLSWWLEFVTEKFKKSVNKDLWKQTLNFAEQSKKDESLSFWSEESSWPSVIDEFVEWVKLEKRGGADDAMDVEQ